MKKLIAITALILLSSCTTAKISDDALIVQSRCRIHKKYPYKYFYTCYQNGLKVRVYSNLEYKIGKPLIIK